VSGFFNSATGPNAGNISGFFNKASGGTTNGLVSGFGNTAVPGSLPNPNVSEFVSGVLNTGSFLSGVFNIEQLLKQLL